VADGEARIRPGRFRGHLARAAVLAELHLLALVKDEGGRAVPVTAGDVDDHFPAAVLGRVTAALVAPWTGRSAKTTSAAVEPTFTGRSSPGRSSPGKRAATLPVVSLDDKIPER
jgi:hypothetical protein